MSYAPRLSCTVPGGVAQALRRPILQFGCDGSIHIGNRDQEPWRRGSAWPSARVSVSGTPSGGGLAAARLWWSRFAPPGRRAEAQPRRGPRRPRQRVSWLATCEDLDSYLNPAQIVFV